METEPDPPDGAPAPLNMSSDQDGPALLSESLDRLSMNPYGALPTSSLPSVPAPSTSPAQSSKPLQMPPQYANNRASAPSSRRSSAAFGPQSLPTSPKLVRKSSGLLQTNDRSPKPTPRRTTSHTFSPRPSTAHKELVLDEAAPLTPSSVAAEHFRKELDMPQNSQNPDTVVIIHDSCYGHRFSRPKVSKINLGFIVERPERIKAGVLGLSNAYVRLGERHTGGHSAPHPDQDPSGNRPFLINKSTRSTPLNSSAVTNVHGVKWMQELTTMCIAAETKLASGGKELTRPETPGSSSIKPKLHEGDLYLCKESLEALQGALGGVLDGVDTVFQSAALLSESPLSPKKAFVCVRPPGHHCSADMPSGFCWLNNVHVGIEHAALNHGLTHAAIIDFDLHHGDGSQSITWDRNSKAIRMPKNTPLSKKTSIGYFSIHDINSYPCEDGNREKVQNASLCIENAHGQSIWNVHLQPWKTEDEFWDLYQTRYLVLLEKARAFLRTQTQRIQSSSVNIRPKAAIFISAGFDASEWEGEGMQRHKVNVPTEFYARFTADILKIAEDTGTSVDGRVVSVLEGGYSDRALMSGIMSHITGLVGPPAPVINEITEAGQNNMHVPQNVDAFQACKPWWSSAALSELEALIRPEVVPDPPRKIRSSELATYATPTQSFTAKIVDPSKVYRSLSGAGLGLVEPRPPMPSAPDVDWATAVHELSKLLIPKDRRVDSCRHEELSEPRVKRERHSSIGLPSAEPLQIPVVQTRGRRAKTPAYNDVPAETSVNVPPRPPSGGRRRTISDLPVAAEEQSGQALNGLGIHAERPTTADSKANSEGSISQYDASQSAFASTIATNAAEGVKLGRTRRQSGALADIQRMTDAPPPVPPLPKELKQSPKKKAAKSVVRDQNSGAGGGASSQANDMETITNGVKKITLRMTKDGQDPKAAGPAAKPVAKAPRKPAAPRAPKIAAAKAPVARATKASKTTDPAPGLTNPTASMGLPVATETTAGHVQPIPFHADAPIDSGHKSEQPPPAFAFPALTAEAIGDYPPVPQPAIPSQPELHEASAMSVAPTTLNPATVTYPTYQIPLQSDPASQTEPTAPVNDSNPPVEFIPFVPPTQPEANSSSGIKPDSLTWLAPNSNTPVQSPVAKRGKENLPVFTADGPIPFAPLQKKEEPDPGGGLPEKPTVPTMEAPTNAKKEEASIWDVPATPQR